MTEDTLATPSPPTPYVQNKPKKKTKFWKKNKVIVYLSLIRLFSALPEAGVIESALFYLRQKLHFTDCQNGWLFCFVGIALMFSQIVLLPFLKRYLSNNGFLLIGLLCNALHMIGYAIAPNAKFMYFNEILAGLALLGTTALLSILSESIPRTQQGFALGALGSVSSLCSAVGPLMFTRLYTYFLREYNFPEFPFYLGSAMVFWAIIFVYFLPGGYSCFKKKKLTRTLVQKVPGSNVSNTTYTASSPPSPPAPPPPYTPYS